VPAVAPPGFDPGQLTAVGSSPSDALSQLPPQLVPAFTAGFHQAFSIALANSMWLCVAAAGVALVATLILREKPLRAHFHAEQVAQMGGQARTIGRTDRGAVGPRRPGTAQPATISAADEPRQDRRTTPGHSPTQVERRRTILDAG
jgi:hypothetical protein